MQDTLETVHAGKGPVIHYVVPESTVFQAVEKMNEEHIGAVLVCISGEMVGIFTERDVLCRVVGEGRDPPFCRSPDHRVAGGLHRLPRQAPNRGIRS